MSLSPSPAAGTRPRRASSSRSRSDDNQHGAALQATVENERQDVLSDVKEQNAQQFDTVDSLHEKLTETTENVLDIFKREAPKVIQTRLASDHNEATTSSATSTNASTAINTSTSSTTKTAIASQQHTERHDHTKAAIKVIPAQPVELAKAAKSSTDYNASKSAASSQSAASSSVAPSLSSNGHVNDDLDRSNYLQPPNAGFEKDTTIIQHTRKPTMEMDEKEAQIQSLSLSLVQTRQAYRDLLDQLYQKDIGAANVGLDSRDVNLSISASSLLTTVPTSNEKSLQSFLSDLPIKKGWLMLRTGHSISSPASYTKYFFTLTFDGLYYGENENSDRGHKIDLEGYWLIEKSQDRNRKPSQKNYAAPSTAHESTTHKPPLAGVSVFRLEDGAYVIRLVPVKTHAEQPQMVIEPSRSEILELTGSSESDVSDSSTLSAWVDAINLRISLLSLAHHPQSTAILAHGGRELLSFLCSVDSKALIIENRFIDATLIFSYFKETLIHRLNWSLVLKNVALNDAGVKVLSEIFMLNHSIYHINLSHNSLTDIGASYLATVFEVNTNIQSIDLSYNQIGQEGVNDIAAAIAKHAVSSITLQGNHINDSTLATFYDTLKSNATALRSFSLLDFSDNQLSDRSSQTISKLLSDFVISAFRLRGNTFTDTAIHTIAGSVGGKSTALQSLTLLDLSYNKLTSKSVPELIKLLNYCSAASLDMSGNVGITAAGLEPLINTDMDLSVETLRLKKRKVGGSTTGISSSSVSASSLTASDEPIRPNLGKRLSIVKQNVAGRVEIIDPLHPRDEKQLGRSLDEVSDGDKRNTINTSGTTVGETGLPSSAAHPPVASLLDRLSSKGSAKSSPTSSPSASPHSARSRSRSNSLSAQSHSADEKLQVLDVPQTAAATELLVDGGKTADPRAVLAASSNVHVDSDSADAKSIAAEAAGHDQAVKAREVARSHHSSHSHAVTQPESIFTPSGLQPASSQQIQKKEADETLKGKYPQADLNNI